MKFDAELFIIIWKYIVVIDVVLCIYYFFIKLNFFSNFDSFDIYDSKYIFRIIAIQTLLWGTSIVWAFPLLTIILLVPYIYIIFQYIYNKTEFIIFKTELRILNASVVIWILALLHKLLIYKKEVSLDYYAYLFLFQKKPDLF